MYKKELFRDIFRGHLRNIKFEEKDIKRTIKELEMYEQYYNATKGLEHVLKQSGLTEKEFKEYITNKEDNEGRIKGYIDKSVTIKDITDEYIMNELRNKKTLILQRLYYGDKMPQVAEYLWMPFRSSVYDMYRKELEEEGYYTRHYEKIYKVVDKLRYSDGNLTEIKDEIQDIDIEKLKKNLEILGVQYREVNEDSRKLSMV